MKKILSVAILATALPQAASALPLVDFYAGSYYWDQAVSGDVIGSSTVADLEDDLKLDAGGQNVTYIAFEHPIPVIPNVKIKSTSMSSDGTGTLTQDLTVGSETVSASAGVKSTLDLSHNDYTLYWSLPLPIVTFDFGLTLRQFDGALMMEAGADSINTDLDFVVPMGYINAGIDIPLTGLSLGANINTISYGDTGITDFDANMTYVLPLIPLLDVGITAGYRSFDLELDAADFGDLSAKTVIAGPYLGLSLHL